MTENKEKNINDIWEQLENIEKNLDLITLHIVFGGPEKLSDYIRTRIKGKKYLAALMIFCKDEEKASTELTEKYKVPQPRVSEATTALKEALLVGVRKEGGKNLVRVSRFCSFIDIEKIIKDEFGTLDIAKLKNL